MCTSENQEIRADLTDDGARTSWLPPMLCVNRTGRTSQFGDEFRGECTHAFFIVYVSDVLDRIR